MQVVEMRPLGIDTVPRAGVVTDSQGRFLYNGLEVRCVLANECTGYLPLPKSGPSRRREDVSLTMWGSGCRG